jgi:hypothetical protein
MTEPDRHDVEVPPEITPEMLAGFCERRRTQFRSRADRTLEVETIVTTPEIWETMDESRNPGEWARHPLGPFVMAQRAFG